MPDPSIFTSVIQSYLPEPHASLLNGILFGVPLKTTKDLYESLKVVGLLHLVVLSGMNITLLASMAGLITRSFSKKISIVLTILLIIIFIIFVGAQAPIIRAGFMGILTSVAIVYGRKPVALYLLFLSGIFIGIFWPEWLGTISFQLSFGATFGIILFAKKNTNKTETAVQKIKQFVREELRISLAAQVFTTPIIFWYFKQISLIAPVANVMVAFTIAPLMIFGFMAAILGKIAWFLGIIPALICYGMLHYMLIVIDILKSIPFAYFSF